MAKEDDGVFVYGFDAGFPDEVGAGSNMGKEGDSMFECESAIRFLNN